MTTFGVRRGLAKEKKEIRNVRLVSENVLACGKTTLTWDWDGDIPEVKLKMIRHHAGPNGENRIEAVENLTKEAISNEGIFEWQMSCFAFGDNHYVVVKEASKDSENNAVEGKSDYFTVLGVRFLSPNASSVWSIWDPQNTIYWEDTTPQKYKKNYKVLLDYEGEYTPLDVPYPTKVNCNDPPYLCPDIHSEDVFSTTWQPIISFSRTDLEGNLTRRSHSLLLSVNDSIVASSEAFSLVTTPYNSVEEDYLVIYKKLVPLVVGAFFLLFSGGTIIRRWLQRKSRAAGTMVNGAYAIGGDGNATVMASNSFPVPFAHAEVIEEGTEQQGGGTHACSNYKAGKAGVKHKQKIKRGYFDFLRDLSHRSHHVNNNCTGGEVVAEAIDIVAATRADRTWIAWSESFNSLCTTEIPGTAPTSPFEDDQEQQQWYAEVIPDEIQPVSVLGDGLGQQQQEYNDEEIPDRTFSASPPEVRD